MLGMGMGQGNHFKLKFNSHLNITLTADSNPLMAAYYQQCMMGMDPAYAAMCQQMIAQQLQQQALNGTQDGRNNYKFTYIFNQFNRNCYS